MMESFLIGAVSSFWLGVLTSISPCPLATNIAAISFIGKNVGQTKRAVLSGILYSLGRMITYLVLAAVIVAGVFSIPMVSIFLQKYINKIIGPLLILVGMVLLELLQINLGGHGISERFQQRFQRGGLLSAGLLGMVFALSFCPVSAALFFGSLIPLSLKYQSAVVIPSLYGMGTALPVLIFAFVLTASAQLVGRVFNKLTEFEYWARRITGVLFIFVGIYFCLVYIFRVL